jgi:hypothetical protein
MEPKSETWEPMSLRYVGEVSDLVAGGQGKTGEAADSGDVFKPPGQG